MRRGFIKPEDRVPKAVRTPERRQHLRALYGNGMLDQVPAVMPSRLLGKALQYMQGQWHNVAPRSRKEFSQTQQPARIHHQASHCWRKGWLFAKLSLAAIVDEFAALFRGVSRPAGAMSNLPIHGWTTNKTDRRGFVSAVITRLFADFVSIFIAMKPTDVLCNRGYLVAHSCKITHHEVAGERVETFQ